MSTKRVKSQFGTQVTLGVIAWVIVVAAFVVGLLLVLNGNGGLAEFYASQSSDYSSFFGAQAVVNIGTALVSAGVIGAVVLLAAHLVGSRLGVLASWAPEDALDDESSDSDAPSDERPTAPATADVAAQSSAADPAPTAGVVPPATEPVTAKGADAAADDAAGDVDAADANAGEEPDAKPDDERDVEEPQATGSQTKA